MLLGRAGAVNALRAQPGFFSRAGFARRYPARLRMAGLGVYSTGIHLLASSTLGESRWANRSRLLAGGRLRSLDALRSARRALLSAGAACRFPSAPEPKNRAPYGGVFKPGTRVLFP